MTGPSVGPAAPASETLATAATVAEPAGKRVRTVPELPACGPTDSKAQDQAAADTLKPQIDPATETQSAQVSTISSAPANLAAASATAPDQE